MARTKASVGAKLSCGKSSKARNLCAASPNSTASPSSSKAGGSGNPYCPRPTPGWQRPITNFFIGGMEKSNDDDIGVGSSAGGRRPRKVNVLNSDTESDEEASVRDSEKGASVPEENAATTPLEDADFGDDLDTSILSNAELPPLTEDENSHKIVEYFEKANPKTDDGTFRVKIASAKGKGKGKKSTKSTTNIDKDTSKDISEKDKLATDKKTVIDTEEKENKPDNEEKDAKTVRAEKRDLEEHEMNQTKRVKIA